MAVRKIVPLGDPRLKAKNKTIKNFDSDSLKKLILDLKDTMRKYELVGIAAPQIGENYKVFITEPRKTASRTDDATDKFRVYINPKVTNKSKRQVIIWEGCGCTGDLFGPVKRSKTVTIKAKDQNGIPFTITADGLLGRIFLHEIDHLNGKEFVMRVSDNSKFTHKDWYVKHERNSELNVKNSIITKLEIK